MLFPYEMSLHFMLFSIQFPAFNIETSSCAIYQVIFTLKRFQCYYSACVLSVSIRYYCAFKIHALGIYTHLCILFTSQIRHSTFVSGFGVAALLISSKYRVCISL